MFLIDIRRKKISIHHCKMKAIKNVEKLLHAPGGILPGFPSRIMLAGPPGSGKRNMLLHLLFKMRAKPFQTITVCHSDENTTEYDLLSDQPNYKLRGYSQEGLPGKDDFDLKKRNLLILDELPFLEMNRKQRSELERLFNHVSTHRSVTIVIMSQNLFDVSASIRRSLTHIVLWPSPIQTAVQALSRMLGIQLAPIFKSVCTERHDSLTIDFTGDGPRIRKNWFEPVIV